MEKTKIIFAFGLMFAVVLCSACSHELKVKNIYAYNARMPYLEQPITVGINTTAVAVSEELFDYVIDEFRSIGSIKIIYPYVYSATRPVDYIIEITPDVSYGGSWVNYFITWPGFLIFTPAWNGLRYSVDIYTDYTVTDFQSKQIVCRDTIRTKYKCAQSEFDRTWTTGVDWLLTAGLCSFFGGFYFISYDDDITREFNNRFSRSYGSYVARKISGQILARQYAQADIK